ncbi:MAG: hypothetical protein EA422_03955 [Gemmatimonadales bacterium]|nr:MAG: hypothetical protein EA422_03955 [Gemmatimonadales bacterium]
MAGQPPVSAADSPILLREEEGIAVIRFDDPERRANLLTEEVMGALGAVLGQLEEEARLGSLTGVVVESGKTDSFILGADIEAIAAIEDPDTGVEAARFGQRIFRRLEQLPIPTVAAIHGACVGGGMELALACTYRFVSNDPRTRMGLPEVQLGILPAWGGTTRLPRLLGLGSALELLLTGRMVDGDRAVALGLAEKCLPAEGFGEAVRDIFRRIVQTGRIRTGARRALPRRLLEDTAPGRRALLASAARRIRTSSGEHMPAPLRILEVIRRSSGSSVDRALEIEARAAGELLASRTSKHLIHVFQLRERARKGPGGPAPSRPGPAGEIRGEEVEGLGVLGAGLMGSGLAQLAAFRGLRVRMRDPDPGALADGLRRATRLTDRAVERGRISRGDGDRAMARLSGDLDFSGFASLEAVLEAVDERLHIKREALSEAESHVSPDCLLTTNTASLQVERLARALERPHRFCGMHFFHPPHRVPLVEVVQARETTPETIEAACALVRRLGKLPVVVGDGPGFVVNRILGQYFNEATLLLEEGLQIGMVDGTMEAFGFPSGPFRQMDGLGLDLVGQVEVALREGLSPRFTSSGVLERLLAQGRVGRDGGLGFYRWVDGESKDPDPELHAILGLARPPRRSPLDPTAIRARLILAMINEAAYLLDEGVARSPGDVDLAMIMAGGFPPFRGGLLRFADEIHPRSLVERLERLEESLGAGYAPAPLLQRLAREDRGFYAASPESGAPWAPSGDR